MSTIAYFKRYYKKHKFLFFIDFTSAFIISIISFVPSLFSKKIIDEIIPQGDLPKLLKISLILIFLLVVRSLLEYIVVYWGHLLGLKIRYDMRNDLFNHLQKLSFSYFDNVKVGELLSRIIGDLEIISELAHHGPEDIFIATIMLIGSFSLMFAVSPTLTLVIFILFFVFLLVALKQNKLIKKAFRESKASSAELNAELNDSLSGIRTVKAYGNENYTKKRVDIKNKKTVSVISEAFKSLGIMVSGIGIFTALTQVTIFLLGGYLVINSKMSLGDLTFFLLLSSKFLEPIRKILNLFEMYQNGMAGFGRFKSIMELDPEIMDSPKAVTLKNVKGQIEFKGVNFSYSDMSSILSDFNLLIKPGEHIALVGESGAGKSTICSLIPRFYDVTSGSLSIDGIEVKNIKNDSLREHIGVVQQEVFLFNGSIRENIAFGRVGASTDEIVEALEKAKALDFVNELDKGIDTFVGERGVKLSGGQKQRIGLARLFLKNPQIIILDEATSALDNQTERDVQEALFNLSQGENGKKRTMVTIAHRLTTVEKADKIIIIDQNGISESGNHQELLNKKGSYYKLYNSQKEGFL